MELYTHLFNKNIQRFFRFEHYIVGVLNTKWINIFNMYNKESIIHQLTKTDKVENMANIIDYCNEGIMIDVINRTYSIINFPYSIYEIDGNYINTCRNDEYFYIIHSHTEYYQTGVFIYNIKNNTFNCEDFYIIKNNTFNCEDFYIDINNVNNDENENESDNENDNPEQTNRFKSLHNKDIISCFFNDTLILFDGEDVFHYEPDTDTLTPVMKVDHDISEIKCHNDKLIGLQHRYNSVAMIYIYAEEITNYIVADKDEYVVFWDIYENYLIIITETLNPHAIKRDKKLKLKLFSI
jgi:hypothetical protein